MPASALDPVQIPAAFWQREDVSAAIEGRDMGALFRLLRRHAGMSQTRIGIAVGMSQSRVSVIMRAGSQRSRVTAHEVFVRIADGLQMPDEIRRRLGLAPLTPPTSGSTTIEYVPSNRGAITNRPDGAGVDESVRRRDVFGLAGTTLVGAILGTHPSSVHPLHAFADVLTRYQSQRDDSPSVAINVASLKRAVTTAKRTYQACRYPDVAVELPALLDKLEHASTCVSGEERRQIFALSAEAHHVAASVLLKLDDYGLAFLAADRSFRAAELSENPLTVGSSARILSHTLMSTGHAERAKQFVSDAATKMSMALGTATPEALSVYGALLLRGALAAVHHDRTSALAMLDEAAEAARRLGTDSNYEWTAFGPTNVLIHRVHLATFLGDAGTAIDYARQVDYRLIPINERRAAFYLDVAQAYNQWGKYGNAYRAVRQAETIAPEEIRSRPSVHRLIADLATRAPHTMQSQLREYARKIGVQA